MSVVTREQIEREVEAVLPKASHGVVVELPEAWIESFNNPDKKRSESPSSIVSYLQCPLRWFVDRHAPFERIKSPTRWTVLGTFVHRVLEVFYSEPPQLRTQELLMEIYEYGLELLEKGDDSDGLIDHDLIEDYKITMKTDKWAHTAAKYIRTRSREIIEGYLENFEPEPEDVHVVSNESWIRGEVNGVRIQGKIDRIIYDENGDEIIEDYKTGKKVGVAEKVEGRPMIFDKVLVPAGIYAWLRMEMTRNELLPSKVSSVRLLYIGAEPEPATVTVGINDNTIERIKTLITTITEHMDKMVNVDKEIIAIPAETDGEHRGYCEYCPVLKGCPAWTKSESLDDIVKDQKLIIK